MKKTLAILIAAAATPGLAQGGSGEIKLLRVAVEDGRVYLFANMANPVNCANSSVAVIEADDPNREMWLSLATTALVSGKSVSMWFKTCSYAPWYPSVPKVSHLSISNN